MKTYVLAMIMLALSAGGVVWIAVKEQGAAKTARPAPPPPPPPPPAAIAEPAPRPAASEESPLPPVDGPAEDAGPIAEADASAPERDPNEAFPPLANYAAWSVVRWGMSASEVDAALRQAGVGVVDEADTKTAPKRVRAKSGPWDVTIELGASGSNQIVVTATNVAKELADASLAKAKGRAPATSTIEHAERRWKKDGGASTSFITDVDGNKATMREEHVRERSPGGSLGFASLRWGMSTQEVVGFLTARGYGARVVKASGSGPDALPFSKGDVEGMASFNQFGLRHLEISGPTTPEALAARAKELESSLGKPTSDEASTKTKHLDHARMTSIEIEVTEKRPGGLTVVETYRPKN